MEDYKKKYEEALEKARKLDEDGCHVLRDVFPELNESEDEKIRKALVRFHKSTIDVDGIKGDEIVAWLEKQGKNNMGISEDTKQKIEDNLNNALEKETPESWNEFLDEQGEQKATIIIPKFRVGDEIKTSNEESLTITKIDEKGYWSEDLFICGFDDAAKWELVEQKSSWSEEDETVLNNLIYALANDRIGNDRDEYISYLKSLKDRNTWKPSDEQIKVCKEVYADILSAKGFDLGTVNSELNRLEEELKKLREE